MNRASPACQKADYRSQVEEASRNRRCPDEQHEGSSALICEKKPDVEAPALPRGDERFMPRSTAFTLDTVQSGVDGA